MADEYVVPFGIDSSNFMTSLDSMISKVTTLENSAKDSNAAIQKTFTDSTNVSKQTDESINKVTDKLGKYSASLEDYGKRFEDLRSTLTRNIDAKGLESVTTKTKQADVSLSNLIVRYKELQLSISKVSDKSFIPVLEEQSRKLGEQIKLLGGEIPKVTKSFGEQEGILQRLQRAAELYKDGILRSQLPENIAKYNQKLVETQIEIQKVKSLGFAEEPITKSSHALESFILQVRGFQGGSRLISHLLGIENDTLNQIRLGLEHTLQVYQSVSKGKTASDAESTLSTQLETGALKQNLSAKTATTIGTVELAGAETGLAITTETTSLAMRVLKIALISTGIGALVVGIGFLVEKFIEWRRTAAAAKEEQKLLNDITTKGNEEAAKEITVSQALLNITLDVTRSKRDRNAAGIEYIKGSYGVLNAMDLEKLKNGDLKNSYEAVTKAILANALAKAGANKVTELTAKLLDKQVEIEDKRNNAEEQKSKVTGDKNISIDLGDGTTSNTQVTPVQQVRQITDKLDDALKKPQKEKDAIQKQIDLVKQAAGITDDVTATEALENEHKQQDRDDKAAERKRIADEKKAARLAEANRKNIESEEKKTDNLTFKLNEEKVKIEASFETDDYERQSKKIKTAADSRIKEIERGVKLEVEALKKLGKNDEVVKLRQAAADDITAITSKETKDQANLYQKFVEKRLEQEHQLLKLRTSFLKDGREKAIQGTDESFSSDLNSINKLRKDTSDEEHEKKITELIVAANEKRKRDVIQINQKYNLQELKQSEELELTLLELSDKYAEKIPFVEEQKQRTILQIKLKYAKQSLEALKDDGTKESELAIANAKKVVKSIEDNLKDSNEKGSRGLGSLLGFKDDDLNNFQAIFDSSKDILLSFSDIAISLLQTQIDKKQELIDMDNKRIDELEKQFDREKTLSDKGLANNLQAVNAELNLKKAAREKDIDDLKRIQKQKETLQKAEIVLDSITQISDLISASTKIFKVLSGIPFVGVPLAIATIATMFGAFAAAKISAFSAVSKHEEGGWIDGKSHSEGGEKFYSRSGVVKELEGNEFVVRKRNAVKYKSVVEALNKDDFKNMSIDDSGFKEMLHQMGISLADETKLIQSTNDHHQKQTVIVNNGSDKYLKRIDESTRFLADKERNKEEVLYEDQQLKIVKIGNTTRRIIK